MHVLDYDTPEGPKRLRSASIQNRGAEFTAGAVVEKAIYVKCVKQQLTTSGNKQIMGTLLMFVSFKITLLYSYQKKYFYISRYSMHDQHVSSSSVPLDWR